TSRCGMDETLDQSNSTRAQNTALPETQTVSQDHKVEPNAQTEAPGTEPSSAEALEKLPVEASKARALPDDAQSTKETHPISQHQLATISQTETPSLVEVLSQAEIARYADQVNVTFPTTSGTDLYRIAEIVPRWRRNAFEEGLEDAIEAY